uniref:TF-B3 domain-containing protein n=1 Tax=Chenopodium quinoa TaxID=63459 RepID=A0A803MS83_CHEQI
MTYVYETCKALEKDRYWHEFPPRKHRFFKLMIGNFEQQLRILRKFVECSREDLSSSCTLRGQSRNIWKVQIQKTEKDVLFADGWGIFVTDHGIKYGCFLVFCYVGDSSFEVSVLMLLDVRGSQSAICNAADKGKAKGKIHEEEDLELLSDHEKRFHKLRLNVRSGTPQVRKPQKYYKSRRQKVTEQEKQGALNKAISHMSWRCHMIEIVMKHTHVYRGFHLTIPKEWAVKHLLQKSDHDVILRVQE